MKIKQSIFFSIIVIIITACSVPEIKPAIPVTRPIEIPPPKVKKPYSAKVDRYSDNVALRAEEVDKGSTVLDQEAAERKIDEESDRLDPYSSKKSNEAGESETSTAVMTLMLRAKVDMLAGRNDAAIDKLERALRIQPNNPELWNKLAEAHYHAEDYAQAVSMAKKSIDLTPRSHRDLLKSNWKIVAKASKELGDMESMKAAMRAGSSI